MASGGARARSGPAPDPKSGRSDRRGLRFDALPSEGYRDEPPAFPLGPISVYFTYKTAEGKLVRELDEDATQDRIARELELWRWAWSSPQACAWAIEPWRHHSVAMWVRTAALCESSEATAADKNSLHRFAESVGLTPAGLKLNGWQIARDEVGEKREEQKSAAAPARESARDRRLRAVANGDG